MFKRVTKVDRDAELMGEDIVGIHLSREPLCDSNQPMEDDEPQLRRFVHDQHDIQQPRLIGEGINGVAGLTTINGVEYVLKVFKLWKQPGPVYYPYDGAIRHTPLARESRAFARLDSRNENGTWAVRCHGWMKLSDTQFKMLKDVIDTSNLIRWAIVKDYIPTMTQPCHFPTIVKNFNIPKEARILPEDIRIDNYRGSKIVDLSSVLTIPTVRCNKLGWNHFYEHVADGVPHWFGEELAYECKCADLMRKEYGHLPAERLTSEQCDDIIRKVYDHSRAERLASCSSPDVPVPEPVDADT